MKSFLAVLFFVSISRVSAEEFEKFFFVPNTVSLIVFEHPESINWETPNSLFDSISRSMASFAPRRVEHFSVVISCAKSLPIISSVQMANLQDFYQAVLNQKLGFGSLFKRYSGKEEEGETLKEFIKLGLKGQEQILFHSFEVSQYQCQKMEELYNQKKRTGNILRYSVGNTKDAENCISYALDFIKLAGDKIYEEVSSLEKKIYIPKHLIGNESNPLSLKQVSKILKSDNVAWQKVSAGGAQELKFYEAQQVKSWLLTQKEKVRAKK